MINKRRFLQFILNRRDMNLNLKLSISIFDAQASKAVFNLHRSPIVMPMVSQKFRFASLRVLTTTHRIFLRSGKKC
jgi:hypothetical protein